MSCGRWSLGGILWGLGISGSNDDKHMTPFAEMEVVGGGVGVGG